MHVGAVELGERALVVDDLIATGGTLCAAMNLLGNHSFDNINKMLVKLLEQLIVYMGLMTGASVGDLRLTFVFQSTFQLCSKYQFIISA